MYDIGGVYPVAKNQREGLWVEQARFGGQARVRTLEAIRQQIYSLPPLSTWVPARPPLIFLDGNGISTLQANRNVSGLHSRCGDTEVPPCTASQRVSMAGLLKMNEDWPGIESIRFY